MAAIKIFYERNLPHYQPPGFAFFVTFRLTNSIPIKTIIELKNERQKELEKISSIQNKSEKKEHYRKYIGAYFGKFDRLLDGSTTGPKWLLKPEIAEIVKEAIHFRDGKKYDLFAYTIMPNHVHLVIKPFVERSEVSNKLQEIEKISSTASDGIENDLHVKRTDCSHYILTFILRSLKWYTAIECNKLLNRSGAFWQHESYDHVVRDEKELKRIVKYILLNPVKAGLCETAENWKWSYYNPNFLV
ncbi:MAG: hypothetical protein KJ799_16660 [Bacteroidetes bacterium]|nr:hypothetical protein [Bacteroidota bacterium]